MPSTIQVDAIYALSNADWTVADIAEVLGLSEDDVTQYVSDHQDYDDSMDGDEASALASAGFGTDEDYGYYGGED